MTALFVTKCSLCNYDASVLGYSVAALSSQILWCITLRCLAITFSEGRCAYLVKQSVTLHHLILRLLSCAKIKTYVKADSAFFDNSTGCNEKCWRPVDSLIHPPKRVVEQKTSCCAKPVRSFLFLQENLSQRPVRLFWDRKHKADCSSFHLPLCFVASCTYGWDQHTVHLRNRLLTV